MNFTIPEDFKPFDWRGDFWNYERNLPHWRQPGVTYFITFRLNDSLPAEVVEQAKREREEWEQRILEHHNLIPESLQEDYIAWQRRTWRKMEAVMDECHGSCILRQPEIRQIVANALLFFEGQRRALKAGVNGDNKIITIDAFVPSQLAVVPLETTFKRRRRVELFKDEAELTEVEQLVRYPDGPMQVVAFVDDEFDAQRIRMDLAGMQVELLACDEECAHAPNQPIDFLDRLVIDAPRPLSAADLKQPLRMQVKISGTDMAPASTGHQTVREQEPGRFELSIDPGAAKADSEVLDLYREPSAWVQSDSVLLKDLAKRATDGGKTDLQRMRRAEEFVRSYIFGKNLSVGYASALEVATTRQGDCTEHALLLTAIARASGIPSRVATGLAYVARFGDREHVFVPHAWTEAYVDGRWQGFDAALQGFDSGHIALAVGDGDPVRYFAGVALLGRLRVLVIESDSP